MLGAACAVAACDNTDPDPPAPPGPMDAGQTEEVEDVLVSPAAWTLLSAPDDPFPAHRPNEVDCPNTSWGQESDYFEVRTFACNYINATQPILVDIAPGDRVAIELFHFELTAREPAVAHAALLIAGRPVWETEVDIPAEAGIFTPEVTTDFAAPEGAPIVFHLHNHGMNTWNLTAITRTRSVPK